MGWLGLQGEYVKELSIRICHKLVNCVPVGLTRRTFDVRESYIPCGLDGVLRLRYYVKWYSPPIGLENGYFPSPQRNL